ncbi:MMPL family transporter (plasmid) [Streptomyces sp. CA-294286]|uniref:MMPL family transporter n=1 Tax=Streptomyces sp. CA-294286 TaxID=3240070 RepID=UPI003D8C1A86
MWLRRHRWAIVLATAFFFSGAGWFGSSAHEYLSAGGEAPSSAESLQAKRFLERDFGAAVPNMVLVGRASASVDTPAAAASAQKVASVLRADPSVEWVRSYWSTRSPSLRSRDGRSAMFLVRIRGQDEEATLAAGRLVPEVVGVHGQLEVTANGEAVLRAQISKQVEEDRTRGELLALPLTAVLLLFVFRSVVAALLPVLVGVLAVTGTAALLRLVTWFTPVSVYASSISYALGFALAVDYTLFLVSRYREELARGQDCDGALRTALATAGRAVAFSAGTVAASLSALLVFPLPVLRSIACGGIIVVVLSAALSLLVLPAVLSCLGTGVERLDVFGRWRRSHHRVPQPWQGEQLGGWGRTSVYVMRRPLLVAGILAACLVVMASPFTHVKFGLFDDRLLPVSSQIGKSGQALRKDFADGSIASPTTVVLPGFDASLSSEKLDRLARSIAALPDVRQVQTATGTYENGHRIRPAGPDSASFTAASGTWLSVTTRCEPFSAQARTLTAAVRALPAPGPMLVGGPGAVLADMYEPLSDRLWLALFLVSMAMLALVLALTRRPVLAVKALVLNALSLSATFGALVFVFQDGHFADVLGGFTATGTTDIQLPVLIFCIAFGLSMDYEIFLLARICEEYQRAPDTTLAVARGLDRSAGLFTWAALIFAVVMAALATSDLLLLKILGVGLGLAVVMDATLIRGLLVPAVVALAGPANWWTFPRQPERSVPHRPAVVDDVCTPVPGRPALAPSSAQPHNPIRRSQPK